MAGLSDYYYNPDAMLLDPNFYDYNNQPILDADDLANIATGLTLPIGGVGSLAVRGLGSLGRNVGLRAGSRAAARARALRASRAASTAEGTATGAGATAGAEAGTTGATTAEAVAEATGASTGIRGALNNFLRDKVLGGLGSAAKNVVTYPFRVIKNHPIASTGIGGLIIAPTLFDQFQRNPSDGLSQNENVPILQESNVPPIKTNPNLKNVANSNIAFLTANSQPTNVSSAVGKALTPTNSVPSTVIPVPTRTANIQTTNVPVVAPKMIPSHTSTNGAVPNILIQPPVNNSSLSVQPTTKAVTNRRSIAEDFNNPLNIGAVGNNLRGRDQYARYNNLNEGFKSNWEYLQNYQAKNKINTLGDLMNKWESNSKTRKEYLNFITKNTGLNKDSAIDLKNLDQAATLIHTMSKFESPLGRQLSLDDVKAYLKS